MKLTLAVFTLLICTGSYQLLAQMPGRYPLGSRVPLSEKQQIQAERHAIGRGTLKGGDRSTQKFTDNGQRLIGITDYDYTASPGSQFLDSIVFKYSAGRGSFFGHFELGYDTYNFSDLLPIGGYNYFDPRINYDTMWSYNPPGSINAVVTGIRTYNVKNDIVQSELVGNYTRTFTYNSRGQMTESKVRLYDPIIGWYDRRHFFLAYDRAGNLIWDSLARFNGTVWASLGSDSTFYDGNGRIKHVDGWDVANGVRTVTVQLDFTYASASSDQFSTLVHKELNTTTNSLENIFRDTIGYTNGVETTYKQYRWDDLSSNWKISSEEHRRLNADNKPDSVLYQNWSNSGIDTSSASLVYNAKNNPIKLKYYTVRNATPSLAFESRWYYETVQPGRRLGNDSRVAGPTSVPTEPSQLLELYPNPVRDVLYLKNVPAGSYLIYNSFAQVVQAGRFENGIALPMQSLSPGQYVLEVETDSGERYSGKVTKE
jgi:hypothetical protein